MLHAEWCVVRSVAGERARRRTHLVQYRPRQHTTQEKLSTFCIQVPQWEVDLSLRGYLGSQAAFFLVACSHTIGWFRNKSFNSRRVRGAGLAAGEALAL